MIAARVLRIAVRELLGLLATGAYSDVARQRHAAPLGGFAARIYREGSYLVSPSVN